MSERQVLSTEEVDAILKVTQEPVDSQRHSLDSATADTDDALSQQNTNLLNNLIEGAKLEIEKIISAFLRKKTKITTNSFTLKKLADCFQENSDKSVYSVFHILPNDNYGILSMDLSFLHQIINHLYGGTLGAADEIIPTAGKAGNLIAEKVYQLFLTGFAQACEEHCHITTEIVKTSSLPTLAANLVMDDNVYSFEMIFHLNETESILRCVIAEDFIKKSIFGTPKSETKHREKDFWRTAIKSQVVDSFVSVSVTLPEINLKMNDFMNLKEGDVIPISDPTLVYICLNNLKLFRARAGQSNSKRVAKIVSQI